MANTPIQRPALGHWVDPGTLYDSRTDTFLSRSMLQGAQPESTVTVTNNASTQIHRLSSDNYKEKFSALKISPELGSSFLSGMFKPGGAADYLNEARTSNLIEQASIHYIISTIQESLNLAHPDLRGCLSLDAIPNSGATHYLQAISWGGQTIVATKHQSSDNSKKQELRQYIDDEFGRFQYIVNSGAAASLPYQSGSQPKAVPLDVAIYSDMIDETGRTTDLRQALDWAAGLPNQIAPVCNGKGMPLVYTLMPLEFLAMLGVHVRPDAGFIQPSFSLFEAFLTIVDESQDSQRDLNDYCRELTRHRHCVRQQDVETVTRRLKRANATEIDLRSNFGRSLRDVRSGSIDQSHLERLLEDARSQASSTQDIAKMTQQYRNKIEFATKMMSSGIGYFGYGAGFIETELQKSGVEDAYVLYFTDTLRLESDSWPENEKLFLQLLHEGASGRVLAMVDCDATGENLQRIRVSRFQNGKVVLSHVLDQMKNGKCVARYIKEEDLDKGDAKKPLRRSPVKIACPGPNCNKDLAQEWVCHVCGVSIEYGAADQYIYCDCGRSPYTNYGFKCKELEHGDLFQRYEKSMLLQLLNSLDPLDEVNILIIGETGVGKSTFINSFINYLAYDTLDDAMNNEHLDWVIPCSFTVQHMDRSDLNSAIVQRNIVVGQDDEEVDGSTGASATQKTTVYPVTLGDTVIRLIDTPGIGDTRGVEKDRENMANILAMLRNFDKLHGILFLLKSNSARLTFMFRFVVKELLMHLHRDAAQNMVFGFTNTRISNYTPGDTFGPLQKLLAEHKDVGVKLSPRTVYCFDSESFRFLAAQKNGLVMENIQDFRLSWEKSESETRRLIGHFRSLPAHLVRSTLSLNQTRDLILHLTRPMADIMQEIDTTIKLNEDNIRELADVKLKGDGLRDRLHFEKSELESNQLDKPRTVCNDVACKEYRDDASGAPRPIYLSMCHRECYLTGVPPEKLSCPELMNCAAFNGKEECEECGHRWEMHLHITYELQPVLKRVKDESVEELLRKNASDIQLKEAAIRNLEQKIAEARYEHEEIQEAAVRFGVFLKEKSITPINDAMLAYLDHLIKEETDKMNVAGGGRDRLDNLLRHRREHIQQVEVLTKALDEGRTDQLLDETGVEALVEHLYQLKHWGKNLKDIKDEAEAAHHDSYRERTYRPRGHARASHGSTVGSNSNSNSSAVSSAVNWLAGRVSSSMAISEPRRRVSHRSPPASYYYSSHAQTASQSQGYPRDRMPGAFPMSSAAAASAIRSASGSSSTNGYPNGGSTTYAMHPQQRQISNSGGAAAPRKLQPTRPPPLPKTETRPPLEIGSASTISSAKSTMFGRLLGKASKK